MVNCPLHGILILQFFGCLFWDVGCMLGRDRNSAVVLFLTAVKTEYIFFSTVWQQSLLRGRIDLSQDDLAESVENSEQLKSEFIDSLSPMNWILFGRLILFCRIPNHCRAFFFSTVTFKNSFFSIIKVLKYKTVHQNAEWCVAVLWNHSADPQAKLWKKFSAVMPDRKNLGMGRQAVSVLQFSKWVRFKNAQNTQGQVTLVFYFPMPFTAQCICLCMCANDQETKQIQWNLIPEELHVTKHSQPTL